MAHPIEHARSSAKKFGGKPEDYLAIHRWIGFYVIHQRCVRGTNHFDLHGTFLL